jgi:hypothetical protein
MNSPEFREIIVFKNFEFENDVLGWNEMFI